MVKKIILDSEGKVVVVGGNKAIDGSNVLTGSKLKPILDAAKSCYYLFYGYTGESVDDLINYSDTENVTNMYSMFNGCTNLQTIPQLNTSKVTDMGSTFNGCTNLTNIIVDINNTMYKSIDGGLYTKDGKTLILYANGKKESEVILPDGVEIIGNGAFSYNSVLTNVKIPNGIKSIEAGTFFNCKTLMEVELPESITYIGSSAFAYCENLTNIIFAGNIEQWEAMVKDENWNMSGAITKIVCSDGTISLKEE